jgi:hypothetical protein
MVDPETGEISDDALAMLETLNTERNTKIENIALYYKNLTSDAAAIKAEEEALYKRRRSAENHAGRIKHYLSEYMPGEKLETPKVKISWRNSTAVQVENEAEFIRQHSGSDFLTCKDPVINKTNISNAIKAGQEVAGAELVTNQNIQVK